MTAAPAPWRRRSLRTRRHCTVNQRSRDNDSMVSMTRLATWVLFAAIVAMTVGPVSLRPHTHFTPDLDRFAAYAALGLLFALSYRQRRLWMIGGFLIAVAAALEIAQLFVPHRDAH